jgi:DNA-binding NarL/FixJ family response regulator
MSIKIILADSHKFIRDDLRVLLERHPGMEVVAEAPNGLTVLQLVSELLPDVVVIDVSMSGLISGIEATRQIVKKFRNIKVIALSANSDKHFMRKVLKAGASAYLLKDWAFKDLVCAVSTVDKNNKYLSQDIFDIVVKEYVHNLLRTDSSGNQTMQKKLLEKYTFPYPGLFIKQG